MSGFVTAPLRKQDDLVGYSKNGNSGQSQGELHTEASGNNKNTNTVTMEKANEPESKNVQTEISATQKMLSAVSGSLLTSLLVTPLDVVRVRLQSQPNPSPPPSNPSSSFTNLPRNLGVTACCREVFWVNNTSPFCIATNPNGFSSAASTTIATLNPSLTSNSTQTADCAVDETRRNRITSTFDGLRKIARNEGPTTLWRGLSPTLAMSIPANVIYFTGYDTLRSSSLSPIHNHISDTYAPLVAGSLARVAAAIVVSPIEMFRTRMQAATSGSGTGVLTETFWGLREMVKNQGTSSLWRGLTLTMWRDVPFSGIYWWGYETIRTGLTDLRDPPHSRVRARAQSQSSSNHTSTFIDSFLAGAISGAIASVVTTPFDVGKTRQQVLQHESPHKARNHGDALRPEDRSMPRFLYHIWREEGAAGLFRGWVPRMLKVAPACAIMISSYEVGKKMARRMNEEKSDSRLQA
ncbi:Carrier protein, mitochondrial [Lecanora helva]